MTKLNFAAGMILLGTMLAGCAPKNLFEPVSLSKEQKASAVDWENPEVIEINRAPARATFFSYESESMAEAGTLDQSSNHISLNGDWKFNWVRKPTDRPVDFWQSDYDVSDWDSIPVPSNWEMQGYGTPYYVNIEYVFPARAPFIPHDYNPVGSYVRV